MPGRARGRTPSDDLQRSPGVRGFGISHLAPRVSVTRSRSRAGWGRSRAAGRLRGARPALRLAQGRRARPPQWGRGALAAIVVRRELSIQEHRETDLGADQRTGRERLSRGGTARRVVQVDNRRYVEGADVWMSARMGAQVDALRRLPGTTNERTGE